MTVRVFLYISAVVGPAHVISTPKTAFIFKTPIAGEDGLTRSSGTCCPAV